MRRNSSRSWPEMTACSWVSEDGHRIAEAQLALPDQHGMAEGEQLGVVGQPVGHLDAGDF